MTTMVPETDDKGRRREKETRGEPGTFKKKK